MSLAIKKIQHYDLEIYKVVWTKQTLLHIFQSYDSMHNIMILFFSKYVNSDILSDLILGKRRRKGRKRPDPSILSFDLTIA